MRKYTATLRIKIAILLSIAVCVFGLLLYWHSTHSYRLIIIIMYCGGIFLTSYLSLVIVTNRIVYKIDEEKIEFNEDFLFFKKVTYMYFRDIKGMYITRFPISKFGIANLYSEDGKLKCSLSVGGFPLELFDDILRHLSPDSVIQMDPSFQKDLDKIRKIER